MDANTQRDWFLLLDAQSGIADRAQARHAGFSKRAIRHRLQSGKWRRVHHGVYATFTGEVQREQRLWAALRRAGPGAMLSHETAAEVHRITDKPSALIHITVSASRRPGQHRPIRGVVIHRSDQSRPARLPEWELPRTRIEDTVLDLVAAAGTFDEAYGWISSALSAHRVTVQGLREAMAERGRIRWRTWLTEALVDADEGAYFPLGVCIELDGLTYHQNEQVRQDKRRDNLNLAVDDAQTFRFSPVDVTERACESAAMVAATLRRRGWRGKPHPCRRLGCKVGREG